MTGEKTDQTKHILICVIAFALVLTASIYCYESTKRQPVVGTVDTVTGGYGKPTGSETKSFGMCSINGLLAPCDADKTFENFVQNNNTTLNPYYVIKGESGWIQPVFSYNGTTTECRFTESLADGNHFDCVQPSGEKVYYGGGGGQIKVVDATHNEKWKEFAKHNQCKDLPSEYVTPCFEGDEMVRGGSIMGTWTP